MFLLAFVIVANELVLTVSTDSPLLCCLSLLLIFVRRFTFSIVRRRRNEKIPRTDSVVVTKQEIRQNSSFKFRLFDKSSHV